MAAKVAEDALASLKVSMDVHYEIGTPEKDWVPRASGEPRFERMLWADARPAEIRVRFSSAMVEPGINAAWEALWDALGACFQPSNRIRAVIKYPVPLKSYVQALRPGKS
jgi:hypothetical protein